LFDFRKLILVDLLSTPKTSWLAQMASRRALFVYLLLIVAINAPLTDCRAENLPKITRWKDALQGTYLSFAALDAGTVQIPLGVDEAGRPVPRGPTYTAEISAFQIEKTEHRMDDTFLRSYENELIPILRAPISLNLIRARGAFDLTAPYCTRFFNSSQDCRNGEYEVGFTRLQVQRYCHWLSMYHNAFIRLPTQAEWEYAARAGSQKRFFWGDDESLLNQYGVVLIQSGKFDWTSDLPSEMQGYRRLRQPRFQGSPWGLHETVGGLEEYVADAFSPNCRLLREARSGSHCLAL
jgi:formylglycine-generating enzyme